MTQPFPPEVCSVCKDPAHSMSLEKRRDIQYMRRHFAHIATPMLPEEYHTRVTSVKAGESA
jgi:hypothetical protein